MRAHCLLGFGDNCESLNPRFLINPWQDLKCKEKKQKSRYKGMA